jgi:hypothetical protein
MRDEDRGHIRAHRVIPFVFERNPLPRMRGILDAPRSPKTRGVPNDREEKTPL